MEDIIQTCPKCQSSNASIRDLKFLVSNCGHSICQKCYELMFQRNEENCPKCGEKLLKANFRLRMFESDEVESYMSYYHKVKRTYNCDETDFETLEEYNDYLEDVETLIHDLMSKDRREDAKNRMNEYKIAHKAEIKMRRNRKDKDLEYYEQVEREKVERRMQVDDDMRQERQKREQLDEEFTKQLLTSDESLQDVVRKYSRIVVEKSRQDAARGDVRPMRHPGRKYRYETPLFMSHPPFQYSGLNASLHADVLLQTLKKPAEGLARGGGYTADFWLYRLKHFCE